MNLQYIIEPARQLYSESIFRNLQIDFLKMLLNTELSAAIQLLPQLAAVVSWDARFFVNYDAGARILTKAIDPS